jgi:hypothetical protein
MTSTVRVEKNIKGTQGKLLRAQTYFPGMVEEELVEKLKARGKTLDRSTMSTRANQFKLKSFKGWLILFCFPQRKV